MSEETTLITLSSPSEVFGSGKVDKLIEDVRAHCTSIVLDVSTAKGRGEIASLAYKVAQTKTALDKAGKELVEPIKARAKLIDEERKKIRDELDAIKDTVRLPLTEWENKEKQRVAALKEVCDYIKGTYAIIPQLEMSSAALSLKIAEFTQKTSVDLQEFESDMAPIKELVLVKLQSLKEKAAAAEAKAEADAKAEAERLERERKEAAAKAEAERIEREKRIAEEAAAKAKAEAEAESERKLREAEAARVAEIERIKNEERKKELARIEAEHKRDREAEAARIAEEKRKADKAHRKEVFLEALDAMSSYDNMEELLNAISEGKIPHVTINY